MSYGPTEASRLITERAERKVAPSTVRDWTNRYTEFMSEGAQVTLPGEQRQLSDRDIDVLVIVARLRKLGFGETQVKQRLPDAIEQFYQPTQDAAGGAEDATEDAETAQTALSMPTGGADFIQAIQAAQDAAGVKTERVMELESRITRLESWVLYGAGASVILLILLVLVLVVALMIR